MESGELKIGNGKKQKRRNAGRRIISKSIRLAKFKNLINVIFVVFF